MSEKRINWLSILQGWAMLLVVIGHASLRSEMDGTIWYNAAGNFCYRFAYSFHMPLFIFISGFLFSYTRMRKRSSYIALLKSKAVKFGIPFLVFTIAGIVLKDIFASYMERPTEMGINAFFHAVIYPQDGPMGEFWFLAVIMWYFILSPILKLLCRNIVSAAVGCIAFAALNLFEPIRTELFCISIAQQYIIYFFAGMLCEKYGIIERVNPFVGLPVAVILYAASRYAEPASPPLATALCGIGLSVMLALTADGYIPRIFSSFRRYTYQIYLLAIYFQFVLRIVYERFLSPDWFYPMFVIGILCGLYIPVIISEAAERFGCKFVKLSIGLTPTS